MGFPDKYSRDTFRHFSRGIVAISIYFEELVTVSQSVLCTCYSYIDYSFFQKRMLPFIQMKRFRTPATLAALGFATLVIPFPCVLAQGGNPLVLCDGINCQLCSLASLAQNIIKFTLLIAIPLSAILFAYAGALYVTARGNPSQIEKAHG